MPPDQDKGKDKDKPARDLSASPNPAAMTSPAMTPGDKPKRERGDKPVPDLSPSTSVPPKSTPAPRITAPPLPASTPPVRDKEVKKDKRTEKAPDVMPQTRQPSDAQTEKPPRKRKRILHPSRPRGREARESAQATRATSPRRRTRHRQLHKNSRRRNEWRLLPARQLISRRSQPSPRSPRSRSSPPASVRIRKRLSPRRRLAGNKRVVWN